MWSAKPLESRELNTLAFLTFIINRPHARGLTRPPCMPAAAAPNQP